MSHLYADPAEPALPATGFKLDLSKAALVVIDPQNDFLSPCLLYTSPSPRDRG